MAPLLNSPSGARHTRPANGRAYSNGRGASVSRVVCLAVATTTIMTGCVGLGPAIDEVYEAPLQQRYDTMIRQAQPDSVGEIEVTFVGNGVNGDVDIEELVYRKGDAGFRTRDVNTARDSVQETHLRLGGWVTPSEFPLWRALEIADGIECPLVTVTPSPDAPETATPYVSDRPVHPVARVRVLPTGAVYASVQCHFDAVRQRIGGEDIPPINVDDLAKPESLSRMIGEIRIGYENVPLVMVELRHEYDGATRSPGMTAHLKHPDVPGCVTEVHRHTTQPGGHTGAFGGEWLDMHTWCQDEDPAERSLYPGADALLEFSFDDLDPARIAAALTELECHMPNPADIRIGKTKDLGFVLVGVGDEASGHAVKLIPLA